MIWRHEHRKQPRTNVRCHCGVEFSTLAARPLAECETCRAYRKRTGIERDPSKPDGRKRRFDGMTTEQNPRHKPDHEAGKAARMERIRNRHQGYQCANHPGTPFYSVLFIDGNERNIATANLRFLCGSCYRKESGRFDHLRGPRDKWKRKPPRPDAPCTNCGKVERLSGKYCHTCASYKSLYKVDRPRRLFRPEKGEVGTCR